MPDATDESSIDLEKSILIDQYKLYVESSLDVTRRRISANTYFLTINTFLFAALGAASAAGLDSLQVGWTFFVSIAGMILCYYWFRLIQSYRGLNRAKFKIIHQLEDKMPAKIFTDEWIELGEGKDSSRYHPVTSLEMRIPWVFAGLYLIMFIWGILDTVFNFF
jgi:hypothetical protein